MTNQRLDHPAISRRARDVLRAWRRAAGPWAPYVWPTLLLAPPPADLAADPAAEAIAAAWVTEFLGAMAGDAGPAGRAWREGAALAVADLPALVALASAPLLARHGRRPVAVIRRWPSPDALLPSEALTAAYYRYAPALRVRGRVRGAVWLVETERALPLPAASDLSDQRLHASLDNRYPLDAQDLPDAVELRARGITMVVALVAAGSTQAAPDLAEYYRTLSAQGLAVLALPLEQLPQTEPQSEVSG